MKRRSIVLAAALAMGVSAVQADEFSNNFVSHLNEPSLDALAQDVGAVMGSGSFHHGKALGFPLGFDVGVHGTFVGVSPDNDILEDDESAIPAMFGQAEVGLPGKINVIGRFGKVFSADMIGGGLRWGVLSPAVPGIPAVSVSALYTKLEHDYLEAETLTGNVVLSFDVPFIHPYVGVGYDKTKLEPTDMALALAGSPSIEGDASGYRVEGGINLSLLPFTYLTLGGGLANGEKMGHLAAGIRF